MSADETGPMIEVRGLQKRYGSFQAVKGIDFEVARGEVFGFLGPNGAGKTTTMKMIAGLLQPTQGQIRVGGHDIRTHPLEAKSLIGYIPDRPYLYEKLTAFEFLDFVGGLHGLAWKRIASRGGELLETFGLGEWADELVENFSHGMKQRLVFCAALLPDPELLIVDEPMVGLDPRGAKLVKRLFRELCADGSLTVFVSTHTLEVAEEVCDRLAILNRGEIAALGTMQQLREARAEGGETAANLESIFLRLTQARSAAEDENA